MTQRLGTPRHPHYEINTHQSRYSIDRFVSGKNIHILNVAWVEPMEITLDWLHACNAFYDVNLLFARIS